MKVKSHILQPAFKKRLKKTFIAPLKPLKCAARKLLCHLLFKADHIVGKDLVISLQAYPVLTNDEAIYCLHFNEDENYCG